MSAENKVTVYLKADILADLRQIGVLYERSVSWLLMRAWAIAREKLWEEAQAYAQEIKRMNQNQITEKLKELAKERARLTRAKDKAETALGALHDEVALDERRWDEVISTQAKKLRIEVDLKKVDEEIESTWALLKLL